MTLPNNISAYQDCLDLLDRAVAAERGVKIRVDSWHAGIHLRNRINYARSLMRMKAREVNMPGDPEYGTSGYDHLVVLIIEDDENLDWWLAIKPRVLNGEIVEL